MHRHLSALLSAGLLSLSPACDAPSSPPPANNVTTVAAVAPLQAAADTSPKGLLTAAAKHLPSDTLAAIIIDTQSLSGPLYEQALAMIDAVMTPAQRDAMLKELSTFVDARLGFSADGIHAAILGLSEDRNTPPVILLLGDLDLSALPQKNMDGLSLHAPPAKDLQIGFVPVDGGALLVSTEKVDVDQRAALAARLADASKNLASSPHLEGFQNMVALHPKAASTLVLRVTPDLQEGLSRENAAIPKLSWAAAAFDGSLHLNVRAASTNGATQLVAMAQLFLTQLTVELKKPYTKLESLDTAEGLAAILGHHLAEPAQKLLTPSANDDMVSLSIDLGALNPFLPLLAVGATGLFFGVVNGVPQMASSQDPEDVCQRYLDLALKSTDAADIERAQKPDALQNCSKMISMARDKVSEDAYADFTDCVYNADDIQVLEDCATRMMKDARDRDYDSK